MNYFRNHTDSFLFYVEQTREILDKIRKYFIINLYFTHQRIQTHELYSKRTMHIRQLRVCFMMHRKSKTHFFILGVQKAHRAKWFYSNNMSHNATAF